MKTTCFKTLKLNNLSKILGERCETGPPLWRHLRKFFKTKKKEISVANICGKGMFRHSRLSFFFQITPFSKFGTEGCPHPQQKGGTDTVSVICFLRDQI